MLTSLGAGAAGEHLVCADLILSGYAALLAPQTCRYDVAVDVGGRLVRVQVKATAGPSVVPQRSAPALGYTWNIRHGNNRTMRGRAYDRDAFDVVALVALDLRRVAYVGPTSTGHATKVWVRRPEDADTTRLGKRFEDLTFGAALAAAGITER